MASPYPGCLIIGEVTKNVAGGNPRGGWGTLYRGPYACLCTLFATSQLHRRGGEGRRVFTASDSPPPLPATTH